jgi:hypothetical protein
MKIAIFLIIVLRIFVEVSSGISREIPILRDEVHVKLLLLIELLLSFQKYLSLM